jgi:hypothetical protein
MSAEPDEHFLIRYLWHHHVPCPRCGGDLHGLSKAACPHCNEPLRIGVGMVLPPLRGWLALAVPMTASGGIGLMLAVLLVVKGLPSSRRYPLMGLSFIYFCVTIPVAAASIFFRRRIIQWPTSVQTALSVIAWTCSAIALVLMFLRGC